jgi:hypothetical protein
LSAAAALHLKASVRSKILFSASVNPTDQKVWSGRQNT